jgi:hypothetical protein
MVPGVREVFYCVPISAEHWGIIAAFALVPFILMELVKAGIRRNTAKQHA